MSKTLLKQPRYRKPKRQYRDRLILASFYDRKKNLVRTLTYSRHETAIPKLTLHAMKLEPGFTIQITHLVTQLWIGDIVVKVNGRLQTSFTWDREGRRK
jgi:hypothetical protein